MRLIDIARTPRCAPEDDKAGASGAGAAGAGAGAGAGAAGGAGGAAAAGAQDGKGGAAGDGAAKGDDQKGKDGGTGDAGAAKAKGDQSGSEFTVKVPDGVKVDEAKLKAFSAWAQEKKLSPEQASEAIAFYAKQQADDAKAWDAQDAKWVSDLKADKDFGGANYDASVAAAQKGLLALGGKELADTVEQLGLGHLPVLVKAFAKAGKLIGEDKAGVEPTVVTPKPGDPKKRLEARYDHPDSQKARAGK